MTVRYHLFEFSSSKSISNGLYELISVVIYLVVLMVITNRNWKIEPFRTGRHSFSISHFWFRKFMAWVGYIGYIGQFQTQKHSDLLALIFICIKGYIIWKNCTRNRLDDVAISNQPSFVSGVLWLFIVPFLLLPCSVDPLESNYRENTFPLRSTTMFF